MYKILNICGVTLILLLSACKPAAKIPANSAAVATQPDIYPDYRDIVVPPNIAPLNFMVRGDGKGFVVELKDARGHSYVTSAGSDGIVKFEPKAWRDMLMSNKGKKISVTVYSKMVKGWRQYRSFCIDVALEPIDSYLSYRLIEPGYTQYRQLGLYQRNLENFDVKTIYENNRRADSENDHCINCHNYQNYNAHTMLFHIRASHGGTLVAKNGQLEKFNMKCDSILSNTVYPSWHPKHNWIIFSSNKTGQTFHTKNTEFLEVIDTGSDLVFFDADRHVLRNVLKTKDCMETFPCWNPQGNRVYFCSLYIPEIAGFNDSLTTEYVILNYNKLRYNLYSISFDERTQQFGTPIIEYDCRAKGKSVAVPRVSPDGKYVLFTLGDYGQFHIWHNSSDLYVMETKTRAVKRLSRASANGFPDSYHTWSSNGRWIVFASRRDDGAYSRPYIAYFDKQGRDHKAFMLPQDNPLSNLSLLKSYNVPELTRNAVDFTPQEARKAIYAGNGTGVKYESVPGK